MIKPEGLTALKNVKSEDEEEDDGLDFFFRIIIRF